MKTIPARLLTWLLISSLLTSCAVHGTVGREDLLAKPTTSRRFDNFGTPPGQDVRSYTTSDGVAHAFDGRAWVEGDSMTFESRKTRHRVALSDISSVVAEETDAGRTLFVVLGAAAVVTAGWFLYAVSHIE